MSSKPLVSVVIPCFNVETTIIRAIASLLNQTYTEWEGIFINDGSVDRTKKLILSVNDARMKYFEHSRNL